MRRRNISQQLLRLNEIDRRITANTSIQFSETVEILRNQTPESRHNIPEIPVICEGQDDYQEIQNNFNNEPTETDNENSEVIMTDENIFQRNMILNNVNEAAENIPGDADNELVCQHCKTK